MPGRGVQHRGMEGMFNACPRLPGYEFITSWPPSEAAIQGRHFPTSLDGRVKPGHDVVGMVLGVRA